MAAWLANYFIYYGITLLLPTALQSVFNKSHTFKGFSYVYFAGLSIIEIAFYIITPYIMNHPQIGRKMGLFYGQFIVFVCSVLIIAFGTANVISIFLFMACIKASNSISFLVNPSLYRLFISIQLNYIKHC